MNKTFAEEWKLYKEGGSRPKFRGEAPRGEAEFDAPVKVGEIRIFADMVRPFVALVAEERGVAGWLIVPVSPFTVPASPREALEGERIYQLWNACTASRSFVARSWRVDEVSSDALLSLNETIKQSKQSNNLSLAADGIVAEYEREFLVSGGDFIPLVDKCIPRVVHVSWRRVCGLAACIVVLLGVSVYVLNSQNDTGPRLCCYIANVDEAAIEEDLPCECEPKPDAEIDFAKDLVAGQRKEAPIPAESAIPPPSPSLAVAHASSDSSMTIRSAVKMRSMNGSRTPGSIGSMSRVDAQYGLAREIASSERLRRFSPERLAEQQPAGTERYAEIQ